MTNRSSLSSILLVALVAATFIIGCERNDNDSPTVTYGTANSVQPSTDDTEDTEDIDEQQVDAETTATAAPPTSRHTAELPPGTAGQQSKLNEGRKAFLNDRYEEAADVFEQLAFDEPVTADTVSAAIALGQIYLETGRSEQALAMFDRLEDHVGDIPEVLLVLARTYHDQGRHDAAINTYQRAYDAKPDYIFILTEMAEILFQQDDEDRAAEVLALYEKNIEELTSHLREVEETTERERIYIADIFTTISDERAHQALEQALERDPSEGVRTQAAIALGESAAFDRRDVLEEAATGDESEPVRAGARRALQRLDEFERQAEAVQ